MRYVLEGPVWVSVRAFLVPDDFQCMRRTARKCAYTHLLHAHFSAHSGCSTTFAHVHACHIHAWLELKSCSKGVCCARIIPLHLAFSLLMFHPSLLFQHGHFETNPDITFLTTSLPNFPVLQAQDMRNSAHASRSLATWPSQMQTHLLGIRVSEPLLEPTMT